MAAMALQRHRFFGRNTVSLLIILPIALPGIVTGVLLALTLATEAVYFVGGREAPLAWPA